MRWICLLFVMLASAPGMACEPSGRPELRLEVVPGEFAGGTRAQRTLMVELHDNGCALIQRPMFWREPGRFVVLADPAVHALLAEQAAGMPLAQAAGSGLREEVERLRSRQSQYRSEEIEVYEVADAGRFVLTRWHGGDPVQWELDGAPQWAEAFPQSRALVEFAAVLDGLHGLAAGEGAVSLGDREDAFAEHWP